MIGLVRKLVAGPKRKTIWNKKELDLTYITDRIIAMAYPASAFFEQTYRNSIDDVAAYMNANHEDSYLIINVSSRAYDHRYFNGRVRDYDWPDHQAPPLTTLIEVAHEMKRFLEKYKSGVVAVHCNHGKGRTGTAIISFFLYIAMFSSVNEALDFYNQRRFSEQNLMKVDQPCQKRYLDYVFQIKQMQSIPNRLPAYRITSVTHRGLSPDYYIKVMRTRTGEVKVNSLSVEEKINPTEDRFMMGDILINLYSRSWTGDSKVSRINCNLLFLNPSNSLKPSLSFSFGGDSISLKNKHSTDFQLIIQFDYFCLCHLEESHTECPCQKERTEEEGCWWTMIEQLQEAKWLDSPDKSYSYLMRNIESNEELQLREIERENEVLERRKQWLQHRSKVESQHIQLAPKKMMEMLPLQPK